MGLLYVGVITPIILLLVNSGGCPAVYGLDVSPAADLLERLIGPRSTEIELLLNTSFGPKDTFQLEDAASGLIRISGNTIPALTMGINHYLKYFCNAHVSWSGSQLFLPFPLPPVNSPLLITSNDFYRYYQNVCTSSYSMVWWDWARWEKEIDWMALNGINLPLAFTAQEAIWYKVYKTLNLTDDEINVFFSGPAFLAWNRMGNMQGFGGPLSHSWHGKRINLQHKILNRMRELGMTPVLPAFAGRVPPAFTRIFPNASVIVDETHWGHFSPPYCCTSFLEPTDPLFIEIGSAFLKEYIKEFGTNHIYNADLFNELQPPTSDPEFISQCGKSVYNSILAADDQAIWMMQGWLFVNNPVFWKDVQAKALLLSVPLGRLLVLDLESELFPIYGKYQAYYGQPFIWNMLHNYGGVLGLYGAFDYVNKGPFEGRNTTTNMVGTGLTPEGIEKNDVMFEFMNEMAWRKEPVDLDTWLTNYTIRRYGKRNDRVIEAWTLLKGSVYNATPIFRNHGQYIMMLRPSLKRIPYVWYNPSDVLQAFKLFVNASYDVDLAKQETFMFDIVDLGRQVFQLLFDEYYKLAVSAFRNESVETLRMISQKSLKSLDDLDHLLKADSHFLLGKWVESAKLWATSRQEAREFEYNARNQISLWGPTGQILDYANKQWSGVISGYIKPRWKLFFTTLQRCLTRSIAFNQTDFNNKVLKNVEEPFTEKTTYLPTEPEGDPIIFSRSLLENYKTDMTELLDKQYEGRGIESWRTAKLPEDADIPWWVHDLHIRPSYFSTIDD